MSPPPKFHFRQHDCLLLRTWVKFRTRRSTDIFFLRFAEAQCCPVWKPKLSVPWIRDMATDIRTPFSEVVGRESIRNLLSGRWLLLWITDNNCTGCCSLYKAPYLLQVYSIKGSLYAFWGFDNLCAPFIGQLSCIFLFSIFVSSNYLVISSANLLPQMAITSGGSGPTRMKRIRGYLYSLVIKKASERMPECIHDAAIQYKATSASICSRGEGKHAFLRYGSLLPSHCTTHIRFHFRSVFLIRLQTADNSFKETVQTTSRP